VIASIVRRGTAAARRRGARGEDGAALLLVVGVILMTSLFLLTSLGLAVNNLAPTRRDQDAKVAIAAAQAGVDEYISRLTANSDYWENQGVDSSNPAFTTGVPIQGTGGAGASYTYKQLTNKDDVAKTGKIVIQVTGTSRPSASTGTPVSRTLTATLTPKGFLSYVYLSDVEVIDPDLLGLSATGACGNYYYANITGRKACSNNIQWAGSDKVNGPLHTNDAMLINGSTNFTNPTTETSWPATQGAAANAVTWWTTASQGYPLTAYEPVYAAPISLPSANAKIKSYVAPDVDGDTTTPVGPGCYYQGATKIVFTGTTMSVLSPGTSNPLTPSRCYNPAATARGTLQVGLPIPPVIYVDAGSLSCTVGAIGYPATGEKYTAGTSSDLSWDGNSTSNQTTNYNCQRGTAFVQGTADAQVNVVANDDIVVTGDLVDADVTSSDVIGLIAGSCVWVYHPQKTGGSNLYATPPVSTIQAAILALRHSFLVQNWNGGSSLGVLTVTGAIAQKFRGPVATSSGGTVVTGYQKNYVYDSRFQYLQPPYFLKSDTSPWLVSSIQDK
jgi:hypothetical protein